MFLGFYIMFLEYIFNLKNVYQFNLYVYQFNLYQESLYLKILDLKNKTKIWL
jgi:hypothetical protein